MFEIYLKVEIPFSSIGRISYSNVHVKTVFDNSLANKKIIIQNYANNAKFILFLLYEY